MNSKLIVPVAAAVVLLVACTVVQGLWTDRFFRMPEHVQVESFVKRLASKPGLPLVIDQWVGEEQEIDPRERDVAGIREYISRQYTNQETGETVSMMLVCGGFRHIAKHTPEMCYPAQGYTRIESTQPFAIPKNSGGNAEFKTTMFKKETKERGLEQLRVFWTWNYNDQWVAPASARWSLSGHPALYKMYLISPVQGHDSTLAGNSPCVKFARAALPELDAMLFPPNLPDKPEEVVSSQ